MFVLFIFSTNRADLVTKIDSLAVGDTMLIEASLGRSLTDIVGRMGRIIELWSSSSPVRKDRRELLLFYHL